MIPHIRLNGQCIFEVHFVKNSIPAIRGAVII